MFFFLSFRSAHSSAPDLATPGLDSLVMLSGGTCFFNSNGAFGQMIFVNRGLGLVVVFTGNLSNDVAYNIYEDLLRNYVVPATHAI